MGKYKPERIGIVLRFRNLMFLAVVSGGTRADSLRPQPKGDFSTLCGTRKLRFPGKIKPQVSPAGAQEERTAGIWFGKAKPSGVIQAGGGYSRENAELRAVTLQFVVQLHHYGSPPRTCYLQTAWKRRLSQKIQPLKRITRKSVVASTPFNSGPAEPGAGDQHVPQASHAFNRQHRER